MIILSMHDVTNNWKIQHKLYKGENIELYTSIHKSSNKLEYKNIFMNYCYNF